MTRVAVGEHRSNYEHRWGPTLLGCLYFIFVVKVDMKVVNSVDTGTQKYGHKKMHAPPGLCLLTHDL